MAFNPNNNQYPMYQNPMMQQLTAASSPQPLPMLKGRPVSSLEEVRAAQVDFDGSLNYFPDIANKRIYTKQIQMDGSPLFRMYEEKPIPNPQNAAFVTKEEFNAAMDELKAALAALKPAPKESKITTTF